MQIREFNSHAYALASFKVESNHCIHSDAVEKTVRPKTEPSWLAELNSITRSHNTDQATIIGIVFPHTGNGVRRAEWLFAANEDVAIGRDQ